MSHSLKTIRSQLLWYGVKLPLTYALIPVGLAVDFLTGLPFRIVMFLDRPAVRGDRRR